jgi:hypothetical protein
LQIIGDCSFLKVWWNSSGESTQSWSFCCWETLHYCFNFIASYRFVQVVYIPLVQFYCHTHLRINLFCLDFTAYLHVHF